MNKRQIIDLLWEERKINLLHPSKLKVTKEGSRLIEVFYSGKFEIDDIDRFPSSGGKD